MSAQIEATLDGLRTKLEQGLPAKIDAVNVEANDDLSLDYPVAVTVGIRDSHDYPRIYVLPEETIAETEAAGSVIWIHRIRIVTFVDAWAEEDLIRKLMRYQRAVREVAMSLRDPNPNPTETDAGWRGGLRHERDEYGPVFSPGASGDTAADTQFVQGAASVFSVRQGQTLA